MPIDTGAESRFLWRITMARQTPLQFLDRLHLVQKAVAAARGKDRRHFDFTREVAPGVRLIVSELDGLPIVFTLWSRVPDLVEICGDGAYPAAQGLLAIDRDQARELLAKGVLVDLSHLRRSDSVPGLSYALFDRLSVAQVHRVLHRVVPALAPHSAAA